jgi:DNA-binding NarL/FixJ family response regulator
VIGTPAVREAVASWINRSPDLRVGGHAVGEKAAFEQINRLRPDLVLTEMLRPEECGFIQELHRRHPRLLILVFSQRDEEAYAPLALEAGARGYLMKGVDGDTLVTGIRKVLNGQVVLSHAMGVHLRQHGDSRCGKKISILPKTPNQQPTEVQPAADVRPARQTGSRRYQR